jgi:hypothetical protein
LIKSVGIRKTLNKYIKESHHSHIVKQIPHDLHRAHTDNTRVTLLTLPHLTVKALTLVTLLILLLPLGPGGWRPRKYCNHCKLIVRARLRKFPSLQPGTPTPKTTRETSSRERGNYGLEIAGKFVDKWRVPRHLKESFT